MEGEKDITSSKQLTCSTAFAPVIYTHVYNQTILRFTNQQINIIRIKQGSIVSQTFLNRKQMFEELQRSFRVVTNYTIEAVFGHKNFIHVLFFIDNEYYLATVYVDNIILEMSRVFESPFCLISANNPKIIKKMLKMNLVGFRVIAMKIADTWVEGLILAYRTVCYSSLYLFTVFKRQNGGFCGASKIMSDIKQAQYMTVYFYENNSAFLITDKGTLKIQYTLNSDTTLYETKCSPANLPQTPYLLQTTSSYIIIIAKDRQVMSSNAGKLIVLLNSGNIMFSRCVEEQFSIISGQLFMEVLDDDNAQELTLVLYTNSQSIFYKINKDYSLKSKRYKFDKNIQHLYLLNRNQSVLFYSKEHELLSIDHIFNPSLAYNQAENQSSRNNHSLTYSGSSENNTDNPGKPTVRKYNIFNSKVPGNIFKNSQISSISDGYKNTMIKTSPTHETQHPAHVKDNMQLSSAIEQEQKLKIVQSVPEAEKGNLLKQDKQKVRYNQHISEVQIAQVKSEDQDSSPRTSVSKLSNNSHHLLNSNVQSHSLQNNTFTPKKEKINAQPTPSASQFISFGQAAIKQHNISKTHQQNIISFGVNEINQFNIVTPKKKDETQNQDEYQLPVNNQRTVSFGKDSVTPKTYKSIQNKIQQKHSELSPSSKLKEQKARYSKELSEIEWDYIKSEKEVIKEIKSQLEWISYHVENIFKQCEIYSDNTLKITTSTIKKQFYEYCEDFFVGQKSNQSIKVLEQKINQLNNYIIEQLENFRFYCTSLMKQIIPNIRRNKQPNLYQKQQYQIQHQKTKNNMWDKFIKVKFKIQNLKKQMKQISDQANKLKPLYKKISTRQNQFDSSPKGKNVSRLSKQSQKSSFRELNQLLYKSFMIREVFIIKEDKPLIDLQPFQ